MSREKLEQCLNNYHQYHHSILSPTLSEIDKKVSDNDLKLHQAIGFNMIIAHALDYLLAIENARHTEDSEKKSRNDIMQKLDAVYSVNGGKFTNNKFQLIDAVNNSIKHINLDPKRYSKMISEYGEMSFRLLVEESGIIYLKTEHYQFDYGRIVLRNIANLLNYEYEEPDGILHILDGGAVCFGVYDPSLDSSDPSTAIDRMIEYYNYVCLDCGEGENECTCEQYIYGSSAGEFNPDIDQNFDVESVISEISSSWK